MILANFNLISAIYSPAADSLIVSGNVYSVPREGELVALNGSLYIVYSVSWAYANPDTSQNMAQTANVRVMPVTATSSGSGTGSSGSGSGSNGCGC